MSRYALSSTLGFITLLVAFAGVASSPASAADWDAAAATKVAEQLPQATEKLYTALYSQGAPEGGGFGGGGDAYHEFKDNVRLLHSESMHLAAELTKGKGQAETKHAYQRIKELNDDASEYAGRQFSGNPVTSEFSTVESLLDQLDTYYHE
jgi:hypothetical protein